MTPTKTLDDTPAVWLPLLIEWASQGEAHYRQSAAVQRQHGCLKNAAGYDALADGWNLIAGRARTRLVALSNLTLADVEPAGLAEIMQAEEPPSQLVPFVGWLVERLAKWLPWVRSEDWQTVAYVLLRGRPGYGS